ncbi:Uncharacterized conserved protein, DUF58 family, contains vWF domain [Alteromonadaceae bacterium Bs31]|nr:Uncharacterized conserved protein, DUF58 family, contains vWF domain [Alteromonadaceae bacterium Bs31]
MRSPAGQPSTTPPRANAVARFFQERFFRFIDKRNPSANQHLLNRKKLYIFPSRRGFALISVLVLLWLIGTNYQNNLILALAFLLTSVFVVTILQTHSNLSELSLEYVGASPAFAGEDVEFVFKLSTRSKRFAESLEIAWQIADDFVANIDVSPDEAVKVSVPKQALRRGWLSPGRMLIQSYFPLGILRCWSWLNWDIASLVYPAPMEYSLAGSLQADSEGEGEHPVSGGEDFGGFKEYTPGDAIKQIAWKAYAQEKGLYVKEFSQNVSQEKWLVYRDIPLSDPELKLSVMCYWALKFSQADEFFGIDLPGKIIEPNLGENHRREVLEALAQFEG